MTWRHVAATTTPLEMVLWKDMAVHDQTSVKLSEKCKVCGELVRPDEMARHRRDSAELHVQLLEDMLEACSAHWSCFQPLP